MGRGFSCSSDNHYLLPGELRAPNGKQCSASLKGKKPLSDEQATRLKHRMKKAVYVGKCRALNMICT